jgi:6-phosphofructokinase 1
MQRSAAATSAAIPHPKDFYLRGAGGLFEFLYRRLREKGHAMVVVANGAGQRFILRPDPQQ